MTLRSLAAFAAYAFSIAMANWLTTRYGLVPVAPGLTVTAGTYAAGSALLARDLVQDSAGRGAVLVGIATGAAITALTSPALAVASGVAFLAAELVDMVAYTPLRRRGWARAVIASNVAGAIMDTVVFLLLAGFPLTMQSLAGQLIGKVAWATLFPVLAVILAQRVSRAIPRNAIRP